MPTDGSPTCSAGLPSPSLPPPRSACSRHTRKLNIEPLITNRAKNGLQRVKGKTKQAVEATGNRRLEHKGELDQAKGTAKNTGE
jgi:uncharacterized protein YjbJ (UPF0337 family)